MYQNKSDSQIIDIHTGRDHEFRPMILCVNFLKRNDIYFHIGLVTYLSLKSISVPLNTKNFNKTESIEILGAGLHTQRVWTTN